MARALFTHRQSGPYNMQARIEVRDKSNGRPITLTMGDGHAVGEYDMTVDTAKLYRQQLGKAIRVAKKAGLK